MSNPELFNDDFWTTKSSSAPPSASAQAGGSSGKEDPPPVCRGCDETSAYGSNPCASEQTCGYPLDGADSKSGANINYSSGGINKTSTDAGIGGGAVPWNSTRTQDSRDQFCRMRAAGTGWKSSETAKVEQYPNFYRVEFSEKDAVNFSLTPDSSGVYRALDNFPETLTIDSNTNIYTIVRKNGTSWDFSGNIPSSALAVLQRVENEEGKQTLFSYDSAGRLVTVQQLSELSQVVSEMGYTYEPNQPERIAEIVVRGLNSGTLSNQKRVVYSYYQDGDSFGNSGDLKTVEKFLWSESEGVWKAGSAEYYRYYTQSNAFGRQHQLRMEFNAVDFAFLKEKFGDQWQFVNDETAVGYSTQYYEYNAQNKVALTRVSRNRLLYQYEYVTYVENRDYNAVSCKTLEQGPHGERTTVFTNFNGDVLLREIVPPDIQEKKKNYYYFLYNNRGNVTHAYNTRCLISYTVEIGMVAVLNVVLSADEGRIEITEYGDGTTTPADQPFAKYVQNGTSGRLITLEQTTYVKRQVDSRIKWYVGTFTRYSDEYGMSGTTTTFSYIYHSNSLQISQRTTVLPDSATRVECYDVAGRNTWQRNELGIIMYHGYDAILGREVRTIQDVDTSKTSDFTTPVPAGWSTPTGAGKHLISDVEYDSQGRVTQALGAKNECVSSENQSIIVHSARWTIYDDANHKITSANGFVRVDASGNVLSETLVNPVIVTLSDASGRLLETISARRISTSGKLAATDTFLQTDYLSWSVNTYAGDRLVEKRDYFDIPARGTGEENVHYNVTRYGYDTYGRRNLVISPDGTVTKTVFDWQNNPTQTWLGTSPSDLTLVTETLYGGEDGGCPTCTGTTAKPRLTIQYADADDMRITEYGYDWRGRRIHVHNEEDADGLSTYALTTYDNLDRAVKSERYLSLDPSPDRLLARTETFYDSRGNVWKTEQSVINPADGTVQGKLLAQNGFDFAGRTVQSKPLGENRVTVTTYDSLERAVSSSIQLDETIFEKTETVYDNLGHALQTAYSQRLADGTGFRTSCTANWFDPAGRSVATANYGVLDTFTRPVAVPERSDVTLVTTTVYDETTGRVLKTIDPAGRETRTFTDALGRTVRTISNFTDGTISAAAPDCNVTVEYTYHPSGQVSTMTVKNPVTGDQTTRYAYTLGRLTQEFYPDSTSPTDCVAYTYNRLGERTTKRDPNGTVHAYTYDNLGRILSDAITQFGDTIDVTVRKITTSYTPDGKTATITTLGVNDTILNQISYEYNPCGLLSKEWQNPNGVVNSESKYVSYSYDTTQSNGYFTKRQRPASQGMSNILYYGYYEYFDDQLNRPSTLGMDVRYEYEGISVPIKTVHQPTGATLDYTPSNVRDRFGRILKQVWTQGTSELVHLEYAYDRLGNRTSKRDVLAKQTGVNLDETYTYDLQNQIIDLNRPGNHEHFHYDSTGNWLNYEQNNTNQNRVHNTANELIFINDHPVTTDASGNMTRTLNLNLTYDAWNRLVRVASPDGTDVSTYAYDGLNRRVLKTTQSETREYYYNKNWQCLEEYSNGTLRNSYLWGIRYLDDLICFTPDYTVALTDANSNVVAVASQSGLTERYTYTAFGTRTVLTPTFTPRPTTLYPALTRTFTSQILDPETDILLYRNRFYSPTLGRFSVRDPIGYDGNDMNLYRYCNGNSVSITDFLGLKPSQKTTAGYWEVKNRNNCCLNVTPVTISTGWDNIPETDLFLKGLQGSGDVLLATNVNDMLDKIDGTVKQCQCLQKLTILTHGGSAKRGGFTMATMPAQQPMDTISGAVKGKEFGEALKDVMCKPCYINVMSCMSGNGDTIIAIARETGCTVRGVSGDLKVIEIEQDSISNFIRVNILDKKIQWEVSGGAIECDSSGKCTNIFVTGSTGMHVW